MIRLVALDIDGTLLDSHGHIPAANLEAVARAIGAGVEVALATGRRYDFARSIFEQLPEPLTLILSNGAVVKTRAGETIVRHLLPREIAQEVLRRTPQHRGTTAVLFDRPRAGQIVYETVDWNHPLHRAFFRANREFIATMPLEDALTEDPIQVMFTGPCAEMRQLYDELVVDEGHFAVSLTEYEYRDFSLVDVIRAGCSKGSALCELAAARNISPAEVMALGDNLNDLSMLEFAGCPVVMGNAVPELIGRGWPVTAANDAAGVAAAIESFVFGVAS
jgi:Cof subfamily protein (haloacid dehalogenase superfamily)